LSVADRAFLIVCGPDAGSNDQNLWMALGGNVKERTLPRKI
jgi:hypothetical protein